MKCIINKIDGRITRVSEDVANRSVKNGSAVFAQKEDWKKQEREHYVPGKQESTMSNLEKRKRHLYVKAR